MAKKKRRRTCLDEMRRTLTERQRQRRGGDPAGRVMLQLITLLSGALAMVPPILTPTFSFPLRAARRSVPPIDDDRGPTAYAMERGIEPHYYITSRPRPAPSWSRLVKDLSRPRKADRSRELLEERAPPAAVEWLREMIGTGELSQIRMAVRPGASDDEITASMLAAAQAWDAERQQVMGPALEMPNADLDETKGMKS